jgi:Zn-dependent M28 family amino/carboxypeptidase
MILRSARELPIGPVMPRLESRLDGITTGQLRTWVAKIARARHAVFERAANHEVARWIASEFERLGHAVSVEGPMANVVARPPAGQQDVILVGAHYDSVPSSPGADDNASAVAALLACACVCSEWDSPLPVSFVAFNAEEDGLIGSRDFVASFLPSAGWSIRCAHILEMVGFTDYSPGSQKVPPGLPIKLPDRGDFLGLLSNRRGAAMMAHCLQSARSYLPEFPVYALEVPFGIERFIPVLGHSDHAPFWEARVPSILWTDTAEFRNPHYHQASDVPETLDFDFLRSVSQVLTASVISQAEAIR